MYFNLLFYSFLRKIPFSLKFSFLAFFLVYSFITFLIIKKYDYNPTSMVGFGEEFVNQNLEQTPKNSVIFKGYDGDLGAGYDGQIFYYYSRTLSSLSFNWPQGFDDSYRAPRIAYPFLVSFFGIFGKYGNIFGLFFVNLTLIFLSFLSLREILQDKYKNLSYLYLFSPFILGSYSVLVSDAVMVSLVIISFYFYKKSKWFLFCIFASLSILTKEPALFLLFPLGFISLIKRDIYKILICISVLIIPFLWHFYLYVNFPDWRANRISDFIVPLDGVITYLEKIYLNLIANKFSFKELARLFSRFPLLMLTFSMIFLLFNKNYKKALVFRLGIFFNLIMVLTASYYHFWSVYENISRMFVMAVPLVILWKNEDDSLRDELFHLTLVLILFLFFVKHLFIKTSLQYYIL